MGVPDDILHAIRGGRRVALLSHVHPDADCLGAAGALVDALQEIGCRPLLVLPPGTTPRRLTRILAWVRLPVAEVSQAAECDLAIVLDTALPRRLNLAGQSQAIAHLPQVVIDHHASNPGFGRWNWIEPQRSSTSEMIFELTEALGARLTERSATLLYAGMHLDTQGFSLRNTSVRTLEIAAALVSAGARVAEVCERLNYGYTPSEFALRRLVYENTRVSPGGRVAWSTATLDELTRIGCEPEDIDHQVEIVRSIEGVVFAMLLTEAEPGRVRVNLRASGASVLPLAEQFGGGGHMASAGVVFRGALADAVAALTRAAMDHAGEG